jgi:hypothetical protein
MLNRFAHGFPHRMYGSLRVFESGSSHKNKLDILNRIGQADPPNHITVIYHLTIHA